MLFLDHNFTKVMTTFSVRESFYLKQPFPVQVQRPYANFIDFRADF